MRQTQITDRFPSTDKMAAPGVSGSQIQQIIAEKGANGWQHLYEINDIPWDFGESAPALVKVIAEENLPDGLAVVPGCGYGYDIKALASEKRKVIGVDIAPLAVEAARKTIGDTPNAEIILHDFFTLDLDGQVDLLYDYTFLCALPPSMRPQWAEKLAKLLKVGSTVVTLMFPMVPMEGGPPFSLTVETYKELLEPYGFHLYRLDRDITSFPRRQGREHLGLWKRISTGPVTNTEKSQ